MVFKAEKEYLKGKKGIIFDLDGTLVDSMMHWRSFDWNKTTLEEAYVVLKELYKTKIELKRDALKALELFNKNGFKSCIATATRTSVCAPCVERLGISPYVEFIICSDDVGTNKHHPDIYLEAARRMGLEIEDVVVFEDQLYAARTAKEAGFTVVAIHDKQSEHHTEELKALADDYITFYSELFN